MRQSLSKSPGPARDFLDKLLAARNILVIGHHNPDGDSLGSASALAMGLRSLGRKAETGISGRIYKNLLFLMEPREFFREISFEEAVSGSYDLFVMVDCQGPHRVWPDRAGQDNSAMRPFLIIDHHQEDRGPDCRHVYRDSLASSSGELIYKTLKAIGVAFDLPMAEALFAALVSDTGSFAQANATPECFSQASDLVSLGVDPERINQRLKAPWSQAKLRLLGAALSGLRLSHGGRLATMVLSQPMLESLGASLEEAEGFIEYARRTEGALAAAVVKPDGRGAVKVSLRSHSGVNVRALAQVFGGGGHDQAAAYTYPGQDPSQAADILEAEAGAIFQGLEP